MARAHRAAVDVAVKQNPRSLLSVMGHSTMGDSPMDEDADAGSDDGLYGYYCDDAGLCEADCY